MPAALMALIFWKMSWTTIGASPSDGSSRQSSSRLRHHGAAEHQHLLLTPAQCTGVLAGALRQSRKHGKDAVHALTDLCGVVADIEAAELEVFTHGQERKDVTAFRHQRDAELAALVRLRRRDILA